MSIASIPARLRAEARSIISLIEDESHFSRILSNELADIKSKRMWRGAAAELLGTALLAIFTIGFGMKKADDKDDGGGLLMVAIACGFFLAGLISALSNVSGAHVNPAISIGFLVTRQITFIRCVVYSLFQIAGAIAGTGLLKVLVPSDFIGNLGLISPGAGVTAYEALGVEILITFFLLFVTLALVDPGRDDLAGSVPLMVGLTVSINILFAAKFSGACMNPARAFGPAMLLGQFENIWIYWAGPIAGAILGSLTYDWFFSTSPIEMSNLKVLSNKEEATGKKTGIFGLKGSNKDLFLSVDDNDEEVELNKNLLKDKLRREHTNGLPLERTGSENRRSLLKERFPLGSMGQIPSKDENITSNENLNLGNLGDLDNSPESKV